MLKKIESFTKQRFNMFFLFSISYYSMTIAAMFSPQLAESTLFPISNSVNEFQPIFIVAIIAIGYSLYRNFKIAKDDKKPIFRAFWRSGIELQIMLWGTLASLMFNLGMLFTESIEVKIGVAILAGIMIGLNIDRDKIVDKLDRKWINYTKHVSTKRKN